MRKQPVLGVLMAGLVSMGMGCGAQAEPSAPQAAPETQSLVTPTEPPDTGDPDRYCSLVEQLESAGRQAFAELGRDATPADYRRVERRFVLDNAERLRQLAPSLPEQLRDDARTFLTAMRQRGGLEPAGTVSQAAASTAERELREFERRACER